jgi:hypothetical protein
MTDRWDEEARLIARAFAPLWVETRATAAIAAALRRAYAEGARDTASMHAVHAECAKIEDRLAPAQPATPRDGGAGERGLCLVCVCYRRVFVDGPRTYRLNDPDAPSGLPSADCPACTKPAAPPEPDDDCSSCRGERCAFVGPIPIDAPCPVCAEWRKPAPVTYRAGTVPPVVRVGMVLRDRRGNDRVVKCDGNLLFAGWTLARDFTEPGGDGGGDA